MKTIWKFSITSPSCVLEMPKGAEILSLKEQRDIPCMWALVDPSAPIESRIFHFFGTGHNVPDNPGKFVGTFFLQSGTFVYHVFEK